jgi:hypothetical protein
VAAPPVQGITTAAEAIAAATAVSLLSALETAQEAVAATRRLYEAVDPENDLVRREREGEYEAALRRRDNIKDEITAVKRTAASQPTVDPTALVRLTGRALKSWSGRTTTDIDRKRILRAVIERVTIVATTQEAVDIEIAWVGGHREAMRALRPPGLEALIQDIHAKTRQGPADIAAQLRAEGFRSAYGAPITAELVRAKLTRNRESLEISSEDPEKHEILEFIRARLTESRARGERPSWAAIARALTETTFRPQLAKAFTGSVVYALFIRGQDRGHRRQDHREPGSEPGA